MDFMGCCALPVLVFLFGLYAFATSLFHLFFQKFTGYSEQGMYVSSFLLMWIGFLLPFSEYTRKDWKKLVFYIVLVYIALFSLYTYGVKSLYVDVPTAARAGGLAEWRFWWECLCCRSHSL